VPDLAADLQGGIVVLRKGAAGTGGRRNGDQYKDVPAGASAPAEGPRLNLKVL